MTRFLIFFLLTGVFFVGCKRDEPIAPDLSGKHHIVSPDSNGVIIASIGDTVEIKILNNGYDGGYRWFHTIDFNPTIASIINYNYEPADSGLYGAPVYEIWRYLALQTGTDNIFFELYQPWIVPHNVIATKTFYLTVQ